MKFSEIVLIFSAKLILKKINKLELIFLSSEPTAAGWILLFIYYYSSKHTSLRNILIHVLNRCYKLTSSWKYLQHHGLTIFNLTKNIAGKCLPVFIHKNAITHTIRTSWSHLTFSKRRECYKSRSIETNGLRVSKKIHTIDT